MPVPPAGVSGSRRRTGPFGRIELNRITIGADRSSTGSCEHTGSTMIMALGFPGQSGTLWEVMARDAFLDALGNQVLRVRILEKDRLDAAQVRRRWLMTWSRCCGTVSAASTWTRGTEPSYDLYVGGAAIPCRSSTRRCGVSWRSPFLDRAARCGR